MHFFHIFLKIFAEKFGTLKKVRTFAIPNEKNGVTNAEIAQLVEHNLAKVRVASSSLVCRSKEMFFEYSGRECPGGGIGRRARFRCVCRKVCRFESCSGHSYGEMAELVDALL